MGVNEGAYHALPVKSMEGDIDLAGCLVDKVPQRLLHWCGHVCRLRSCGGQRIKKHLIVKGLANGRFGKGTAVSSSKWSSN